MQEYSVTFAIQAAPVDPFEPNGDVEYRLVARCKPLNVSFAISPKYETPDQALAPLAAFGQGVAKLETLLKDVLNMYGTIVDAKIQSVEDAVLAKVNVIARDSIDREYDHIQKYEHKERKNKR